MRRQQGFGQAFGLAAENQKIAGEKIDVVLGALRFRGEKKEARSCLAGSTQILEGIPELEIDFLPVIESSPFERAIVDRESERLNKMQRGSRRETKPADVARIRRNLRLDKDDVEHVKRQKGSGFRVQINRTVVPSLNPES
jgi:hypothetical protein